MGSIKKTAKKSLTFRTKLFIIIASIVTGIFLCTFCIIIPLVTKRMEKNIQSQLEEQGNHVITSVDYYLDQMRSIYLSISSDAMLQEAFATSSYQNVSTRYQYPIKNLDTMTSVFGRSYSVYFYDITEQRFFSSDVLSSISMIDDTWMHHAIEKEGMRNFVLITDKNGANGSSSTSCIIIGGTLRYNIVGRPLAYFSINAKVDSMQKLIFPALMTEGTLQGIYDASGQYLFGTLSDFDVSSTYNASGKININGIVYQLCITESTAYQWKFVTLIPVCELYSSIVELQNLVFWIMILALAAALFLAFFVSNHVTYPIRKLSKAVNAYRNGGLETCAIPDLKRNDEFKVLNDGLINMTERIDHLIENVYHSELENKKMELRILHRAIDPHFIYNVLDSIYWTLQLNQTQKAGDTILAFSYYLRSTLSLDQHLCTLERLQKELNAYCELQKVFEHENITWEISFPQELLSYQIPGMLLQPLIENAYVHAFPQSWKENGCIKIKAEKKQESLLFTVEDNGAGISEEDLKLIQDILKKNQNTVCYQDQSPRFFAFRNIQTRIHIQYGDTFGLSVESRYQSGTRVSLSLPYENKLAPNASISFAGNMVP